VFWDFTFYNIFIYLEDADHLYFEMTEQTKYTIIMFPKSLCLRTLLVSKNNHGYSYLCLPKYKVSYRKLKFYIPEILLNR